MKQKLTLLIACSLLLVTLGCKSLSEKYIENVTVNITQLQVDLSAIFMGKVTLITTLDIQNDNLFPTTITSMSYQIAVKDTIVAKGETVGEKKYRVNEASHQKVDVSIHIPANIYTYKALEKYINKKEKITLTGSIIFNTPVGDIKSPFKSTLK